MSRSKGRRAGSRKVDSRSKTRVRNTPSGLVIARITSRNSPIWNQPLGVISKLLRFEQGVEQVAQQEHAYDQKNHVFSAHVYAPSAGVRMRERREWPARRTLRWLRQR